MRRRNRYLTDQLKRTKQQSKDDLQQANQKLTRKDLLFQRRLLQLKYSHEMDMRFMKKEMEKLRLKLLDQDRRSNRRFDDLEGQIKALRLSDAKRKNQISHLKRSLSIAKHHIDGNRLEINLLKRTNTRLEKRIERLEDDVGLQMRFGRTFARMVFKYMKQRDQMIYNLFRMAHHGWKQFGKLQKDLAGLKTIVIELIPKSEERYPGPLIAIDTGCTTQSSQSRDLETVSFIGASQQLFGSGPDMRLSNIEQRLTQLETREAQIPDTILPDLARFSSLETRPSNTANSSTTLVDNERVSELEERLKQLETNLSASHRELNRKVKDLVINLKNAEKAARKLKKDTVIDAPIRRQKKIKKKKRKEKISRQRSQRKLRIKPEKHIDMEKRGMKAKDEDNISPTPTQTIPQSPKISRPSSAQPYRIEVGEGGNDESSWKFIDTHILLGGVIVVVIIVALSIDFTE